MPKDKPDWQSAIQARAQLTQKRLCDEIRKLMESPDNYAIAVALADAYLADLEYLSHFSALIDGHGNPVDMSDVRELLYNRLREKFLLLTGRPYLYPIERDHVFRDNGPQT